MYYVITNIGTYDCDVQECKTLQEALSWLGDYAGIECIIAKKLEAGTYVKDINGQVTYSEKEKNE